MKNTKRNDIEDVFRGSLQEFGSHELLRRLREHLLTPEEFMRVSKIRLDAAESFVPFLTATEAKVRKESEWKHVADAMLQNAHEEIGFIGGKIQPENAHAHWRNQYRAGLARVSKIRGINFESMRDETALERIDEIYAATLRGMPEHRSVPFLAAGFATLEGLLEQEFGAMNSYIRSKLGDLTRSERLYIQHHAGHEKEHARAAMDPLLDQVDAHPEIFGDVLAGIHEIQQLRSKGVLSVIEDALS